MSARFQATIKAHREACNLTQPGAAARCQLDPSLINRLETGQRNPTRENIRKLAIGYDLTATAHDALLALAGFAATDPLAAVADEPVVLTLYRALRDETVPRETRAQLRAIVGGALALAIEEG